MGDAGGLQHMRQNAAHDLSHSGFIRMHAIGLVQLRIGSHSFKEKGIERNVIFSRQITIDALERRGVIRAEIGRCAHPDQQHSRFRGFQPGQHGVEIGASLRRIGAAQHVVGSQFEDDQIGFVRKRPIQPRQSARGGVAGDAGVDDFGLDSLLAQRLLELRCETLPRKKTVTGGKAVAEGEDPQWLRQSR